MIKIRLKNKDLEKITLDGKIIEELRGELAVLPGVR
jgi:hypothetical protein